MPAHAGTGVEGHEPEWFGAGGLDDLPQVDVELAAEHRHLVDPERVLQQLGHFGLTGALDLHDGVADLRVELYRVGGWYDLDPGAVQDVLDARFWPTTGFTMPIRAG